MPYKSGRKRTEYNKQYWLDNREKLIKQQRDRWEKRRQYTQEYKLSKGCKICGYNKCAGALDFHHSNDDKEFTIGSYSIMNLERIEREIKKCVVLCRNCHAELHEKEREL